MVNLKSIGKRSEMTDPQDPHKVIVVYDVYAVWQKDEVAPDNPYYPHQTPDTPGGHNGEITPGEPSGGPGTVTPDNPVTPDTPVAPDNPSVTPSTNETPSQPTKTEKTTVTRKKTDIPDTGDASSMTGVIVGLASLFGSFAFFRKRKNQ